MQQLSAAEMLAAALRLWIDNMIILMISFSNILVFKILSLD